MSSSLRIQRLGIEFENFMSDEGLINQLNDIIFSNNKYIKTLIIKNFDIINL